MIKELNEALHSDELIGGVVVITFEKADGSERTMTATLDYTLVPEDKKPSGGNRKSNPDVRPVFDVKIEEWRSFRWDRVKTFSYALENGEIHVFNKGNDGEFAHISHQVE